jgi:hypothetical protein
MVDPLKLYAKGDNIKSGMVLLRTITLHLSNGIPRICGGFWYTRHCYRLSVDEYGFVG